MKTYQHTQRGTLIIVTMLLIILLFVVLGCFGGRQFLITTPLLLLSGWLFSSLTIEIADGELRWRFGPGLISKRVPLANIASANVVRTNFLEGWGIHLSRFGWLYNVSGFDAVALTTRTGKRFALGTDDPAALAKAINQAEGQLDAVRVRSSAFRRRWPVT